MRFVVAVYGFTTALVLHNTVLFVAGAAFVVAWFTLAFVNRRLSEFERTVDDQTDRLERIESRLPPHVSE